MSSYIPKFPPYEHQDEALGFLERRPMYPSSEDVAAWLMEFGTGKTYVGLREFGIRELAGDLYVMVVVAPKGVYRNWILNEIPMHLSEDLQERALIGALDVSIGKERRANAEKLIFTRDRPRIIVINVEAFSGVERIQEAIIAALEGCRDEAMIFIDEATRIKGYGYYKVKGGISGSKRSAFIVEKLAPLARVRRIATGLVAPNSPLDVYMPFAFLDYRILGHQTYQDFKARYCKIQYTDFVKKEDRAKGVVGKERGIIRGFRNEAELNQKLAPYAYRVRKKDCLDLPEKIYQFRDVDMTPKQEKMYNDLKAEAIAEFENTRVTATMVMTRIMRLHQIACGYVVDDDKNIHFLEENRTKALIEMLEDHDGKVIIWAPYRSLIQKISAELRRTFGNDSTVEFWGDTKQKDRDEALRRFREDPRCTKFISNQSVGGAGNTMITSHFQAFYANSWSLESRANAEDRIHRIGQKESCLYVDLRVPGTVDDRIIQKLRKKIDVASAIMGDDWREWLI